jgi:hypothetical protein
MYIEIAVTGGLCSSRELYKACPSASLSLLEAEEARLDKAQQHAKAVAQAAAADAQLAAMDAAVANATVIPSPSMVVKSASSIVSSSSSSSTSSTATAASSSAPPPTQAEVSHQSAAPTAPSGTGNATVASGVEKKQSMSTVAAGLSRLDINAHIVDDDYFGNDTLSISTSPSTAMVGSPTFGTPAVSTTTTTTSTSSPVPSSSSRASTPKGPPSPRPSAMSFAGFASPRGAPSSTAALPPHHPQPPRSHSITSLSAHHTGTHGSSSSSTTTSSSSNGSTSSNGMRRAESQYDMQRPIATAAAVAAHNLTGVPNRNIASTPIGSAFGEPYLLRKHRIRSTSPHRNNVHWDLVSVIFKGGDDCRQEGLAMQLIILFDRIWRDAGLDLRLRPYAVLVTSPTSGLIETVPDATSIDSLKKNTHGFTTLAQFFIDHWGPIGSRGHSSALRRFVESMAAYALVTYFLQIKDRHNGNIMLARDGQIIHIDFGFMFRYCLSSRSQTACLVCQLCAVCISIVILQVAILTSNLVHLN